MFNKLFSFLGGNSKKGVEGDFYPLTNSNYGIKELTRTDYLKLYTSWQYTAISTIANSVAELDYMLLQNENSKKEIEHPYKKLITYNLLLQIVSSLELTGTCYLMKSYIGSRVDSLDLLRTDLVEIEENSDGSLKSYLYYGKNNQFRLKKEDIIAINLYNPMKSYPYEMKGVSPMQSVAIQAEMDQTANKWNWGFFKRGASIGGTLESEQSISPENKQRLISKWKQEFQGVNNSHKIAILDQGLKYHEFQISKKELDFVESRRFTRDEIFAIFKIPKEILGIFTDANRASSKESQTIYYRNCIRPITKQIMDALNQQLFAGYGYFKFVNVVPADIEQLLLDYNNGAITLNEYRQVRGFDKTKNGDIFKLDPTKIVTDFISQEPKKDINQLSELVVKTFLSNLKGTKENKEKIGEDKWKKKILRTNTYEEKYIKIVNDIFNKQEQDIISQIGQKAIKEPKFDNIKYSAIWQIMLTSLYNEIFLNEGTEAFNQIGLSTFFSVGNPKINRYIKDNITRMAKEVDMTTKEEIFKIISDGNDKGLGAVEISKNISGRFQEFRQTRSEKIARTEITLASTQAEITARDESGVVSGKEWYTALDERTCQYCNSMHGKITELNGDYFKKGDTLEVDGGKLALNYTNVKGPSLHTNCRCTLLPIIKE